MNRRPFLRYFVAALTIAAMSTIAQADWDQGMEAFNDGNFQVAAEHFTETIRTNPKWSGGYYMLGRCQSELDQKTQAIASLRKAFDLNSSDANTIIALSRELVSAEDFTQTQEILGSTTIANLPVGRRSEATALLASALLGDGNAQGAIDILKEHLAEDTTNPTLFQILGQAQAATGDQESAFASYSRAFEIKPDERSGRAATRTGLSLAGAAVDDGTKANWYRKTLSIGSQLATTFPKEEHDLLAGRAALGAANFESAERWFKAGTLKSGANPETRYLLGWALTQLGRDDEAFETFSVALTLGPDAGLARRIHGRLGNIAACRLKLESATSHYRLAGQDDRARKTQTLASQFAGALTQLKKLRTTVTEIQGMERQLKELGDDQGVAAMRERAAAEQSKIDEIEKNLEAVRSALCE